MNLNRRSFLQMLGVGGMGVLATQASALIPCSDRRLLIRADQILTSQARGVLDRRLVG